MVISWNATVETLLENLSTFLEPFYDESNKIPKDIDEYIVNFIYFSIIWSIGCIIEERGRPKFHKFLLEMIEGVNVVKQYTLDLSYEKKDSPWESREWNVKLKETKNIYEMCYNPKNNNWVHWM